VRLQCASANFPIFGCCEATVETRPAEKCSAKGRTALVPV
jgi:hypothetical protein